MKMPDEPQQYPIQSEAENSSSQQLKWDRRFMDLARLISTWSKDRSTQVGCVIVGRNHVVHSTGYNGFPRGIDDEVEERHQRPVKYLWTEHAERNAIYNAASSGIPLLGSTAYVTWYPCVDCARALVQSGIRELVAFEPDWHDPKWGEHFLVTRELLAESGMAVRFLPPDLFG